MLTKRSLRKASTLSPALIKTLGATAFILGASFCLAGAEWHSSPALYYVNQLPISWVVYGIVLLLGAIFIWSENLRPVGFLIGAVSYTFFTGLVWLAVLGGFHLNVFLLENLNFPDGMSASFFAACNLTTICVLYWSALRHSIYRKFDPEGQQLVVSAKEKD